MLLFCLINLGCKVPFLLEAKNHAVQHGQWQQHFKKMDQLRITCINQNNLPIKQVKITSSDGNAFIIKITTAYSFLGMPTRHWSFLIFGEHRKKYVNFNIMSRLCLVEVSVSLHN